MEYNDKDMAIIVFAKDFNKKYPELKIFDEAIFNAQEHVKYSSRSLLERLINKKAISPRTVDVIDSILSRTDYKRATLMAKVGKVFYKKIRNLTFNSQLKQGEVIDHALEKQRDARENGGPGLDEILEQEGISQKDLRSIAIMQVHYFLQKNPHAMEEARDRLESKLSLHYLKRKKVLGKNPVKNAAMIGLLAGLTYAAGVIWFPESGQKRPETNYQNLPKYYQSVFTSIKFPSEDSFDTTYGQIELARDCIEHTMDKGNDKQKKEAQMYKKRLDLVEVNMDKLEKYSADKLTTMEESDIEKILVGE